MGRTDEQNSDHEDATSAVQREDCFIDSDYWFGSIYFRCVLAQEVFGRVTPGCSFITVDSLLQSQLDSYTYPQALEACEGQGLASPESNTYEHQGNHRTALMILIGSVIRNKTNEERQILLHLIRTNINLNGSRNSRLNHSAASSRSSAVETVTEPMPLPTPEYESDLCKYTSVLKEKGDVAGFVPKYNFKNVSQTPQTPPNFKAVVSFWEYVFEGSGRTKNQAKHEASKEACKSLGLRIS